MVDILECGGEERGKGGEAIVADVHGGFVLEPTAQSKEMEIV